MSGGSTKSERSVLGESAPLPLFYFRPEPLTPERHGGKSLRTLDHYRFAAKTNALPLNTVEFALAAKFYPIVFTDDDDAMPVAVVGLRINENLFISNKDGRWCDNAYVPAYVRRYPFIFMDGPEEGQLVLSVEEASGLITEGDERPLFNGNRPTSVSTNALAFCSSYHEQYTVTQEFAQDLLEHDLLAPHRENVTIENGATLGLSGFCVVDQRRFNALSDDLFLDWRAKGWLDLIYAHIFSGANWGGLARQAAAR